MKHLTRTALFLASLGAGAAALRRLASPPPAARWQRADRWLAVTVNRPPAEVMAGGTPPEPLDRFGDEVEVRVQLAPGGRGTELAARPHGPVPPEATSLPARVAGQDPRQRVRLALREAKARLETGEVMQPDAPPTARDDTLGSRIVGLAARRSGGEGVL